MAPGELDAAVRRFMHEIVLPQAGAWDRADDLPAAAARPC
jgi:hypothetical protein